MAFKSVQAKKGLKVKRQERRIQPSLCQCHARPHFLHPSCYLATSVVATLHACGALAIPLIPLHPHCALMLLPLPCSLRVPAAPYSHSRSEPSLLWACIFPYCPSSHTHSLILLILSAPPPSLVTTSPAKTLHPCPLSLGHTKTHLTSPLVS